MNRQAGETACPTAKWFGCNVGHAVLPAFRGVRPILSHLLSLAARKRIAAAQRKRWAEFKARQAPKAAKRHRKPGKAVKPATA
jgi:hypothetical protein